MVDTTTSFQSSWTLAESIIQDVSAFQRIGRGAWLVGNLEKYYWNFEALVRTINGILDEDERISAREKEHEILSNFPITENNKNKVSALLKEYEEMIIIILHKHKLDVPPKKDMTFLGS